jgi:hypothetical protein
MRTLPVELRALFFWKLALHQWVIIGAQHFERTIHLIFAGQKVQKEPKR